MCRRTTAVGHTLLQRIKGQTVAISTHAHRYTNMVANWKSKIGSCCPQIVLHEAIERSRKSLWSTSYGQCPEIKPQEKFVLKRADEKLHKVYTDNLLWQFTVQTLQSRNPLLTSGFGLAELIPIMKNCFINKKHFFAFCGRTSYNSTILVLVTPVV